MRKLQGMAQSFAWPLQLVSDSRLASLSFSAVERTGVTYCHGCAHFGNMIRCQRVNPPYQYTMPTQGHAQFRSGGFNHVTSSVLRQLPQCTKWHHLAAEENLWKRAWGSVRGLFFETERPRTVRHCDIHKRWLGKCGKKCVCAFTGPLKGWPAAQVAIGYWIKVLPLFILCYCNSMMLTRKKNWKHKWWMTSAYLSFIVAVIKHGGPLASCFHGVLEWPLGMHGDLFCN